MELTADIVRLRLLRRVSKASCNYIAVGMIKGQFSIKLAGIDTMEAAQAMRGKVVKLYREDIDDEVIFAAELIGVQVFEDGRLLGKITQVLDYPGNKVYVVKGEHEYMIPAVKAFVLDTDMANETMQVKTIEGMRTDES